MAFLPSKLGAENRFLPSEAKQKDTVLQSLASGQYDFVCLIQVRISILLPPSVEGIYDTIVHRAGRQTHTIQLCVG